MWMKCAGNLTMADLGKMSKEVWYYWGEIALSKRIHWGKGNGGNSGMNHEVRSHFIRLNSY